MTFYTNGLNFSSGPRVLKITYPNGVKDHMSHEVESMAYYGKLPWHGLGRRLLARPHTSKEAIEQGGLDWEVEQVPQTYCWNGQQIASGMQAIIRKSDGAHLGNVGSGYHAVQNVDTFKMFDDAIEQGLLNIETVGSLKGGRRVWMLAKVEGAVADIVKGDEVNGYFMISNSHDGSLTIRVGFTKIRVVCHNTIQEAHDTSDLIRIRHTKTAVIALSKLQEIIDFQRQRFAGSVEQMRQLARLGATPKTLRAYVEQVFRAEVETRTVSEEDTQKSLNRLHAKIVPLFEKGRGNDMPGVAGTMWGAYNAVSEYLTWERGKNANTRLDSLWFGDAAKLNAKAYEQAFKVAA